MDEFVRERASSFSILQEAFLHVNGFAVCGGVHAWWELPLVEGEVFARTEVSPWVMMHEDDVRCLH